MMFSVTKKTKIFKLLQRQAVCANDLEWPFPAPLVPLGRGVNLYLHYEKRKDLQD